MAELPEHLKGHLSDSAGQPWQGRSFTENRWSDDDGTAPAVLLAALAGFHAGTSSLLSVVEALRDTRLLIPLVAELGVAGENDSGVLVEKQADLSIVTVRAPDGRGIVPMFTSVAAMRVWDPQARPVPVASRQAALAVVAEGNELIILDPGSETETAIRRPAVWAIARDAPYELPWQNPQVVGIVSRLLEQVPELVGADLLPGDPTSRLVGSELVLLLHVPAAAVQSERDALVARAQAVVQDSAELVEFVDTLTITVRAAAERTATGSTARGGLFRRRRR